LHEDPMQNVSSDLYHLGIVEVMGV
jgi:hypothetical protein